MKLVKEINKNMDFKLRKKVKNFIKTFIERLEKDYYIQDKDKAIEKALKEITKEVVKKVETNEE